MRFFYFLLFFLAIGCSNIKDENKSYAITRDTLNKFPDKLIVEGKIVEIGNGGVPCGNNRMGCQTFKLKLSNDVDSYEENYVFVAVPCMTKPYNELLKKKTKIELIKIPLNNTWACFQGRPTQLNSEGIPFYQPVKEYSQLEFY